MLRVERGEAEEIRGCRKLPPPPPPHGSVILSLALSQGQPGSQTTKRERGEREGEMQLPKKPLTALTALVGGSRLTL